MRANIHVADEIVAHHTAYDPVVAGTTRGHWTGSGCVKSRCQKAIGSAIVIADPSHGTAGAKSVTICSADSLVSVANGKLHLAVEEACGKNWPYGERVSNGILI